MAIRKALIPLSLAFALGLTGCSSIPFLNSGEPGDEVVSEESGMTVAVHDNMENAVRSLIEISEDSEFTQAVLSPSVNSSTAKAGAVSLDEHGEAVQKLQSLVAGDSHLAILSQGMSKTMDALDIEATGLEMETFSRGHILKMGDLLPTTSDLASVTIDPNGFELRDGVWYQTMAGAVAITDSAGRHSAAISNGMSFSEDGSQLSVAAIADMQQFMEMSEHDDMKKLVDELGKILDAVGAKHGGADVESLDVAAIVADSDAILSGVELADGVSASMSESVNGDFLLMVTGHGESLTYDSSATFMGEETGMYFPTSMMTTKANLVGIVFTEVSNEAKSGPMDEPKEVALEQMVEALNGNDENPDFAWSLGDGGEYISASSGDETIELTKEAVDRAQIRVSL